MVEMKDSSHADDKKDDKLPDPPLTPETVRADDPLDMLRPNLELRQAVAELAMILSAVAERLPNASTLGARAAAVKAKIDAL